MNSGSLSRGARSSRDRFEGALLKCSISRRVHRPFIRYLELQAVFTGSVGQGFDASVIQAAVAVETHGGDVFGLGVIGQGLSDLLGGFDVAAVDLERDRGRGRERAAVDVVDDLRVDVVERTVYAEPRGIGRAGDGLAHPAAAALE